MIKFLWFINTGVFSGVLLLLGNSAGRADELSAEYKACIAKGLEWLAKKQFEDGHWEAKTVDDRYPAAMTALCGMAMLMEGSTLREGKYAHHLRRAVDWFIAHNMPNGLLCDPRLPGEGRYMYGQGFGLLFLASVYGDVVDGQLRRKLEQMLTRAVQFTCKAQSSRGGWHYVSAADSGDQDEGSLTVTQMQALRAARNSGIVVPKETINKGVQYLKMGTNRAGGVRYSSSGGGVREPEKGRPALTAAAITCSFSAGEYDSDLVKKWITFCRKNIPFDYAERTGHDEYVHLYFAQLMYNLGEDRYARLFPHSRPEEHLTWSKYRKIVFAKLVRSQGADGRWQGYGGTACQIGPVYVTALHLIILQLDGGALPIYQR